MLQALVLFKVPPVTISRLKRPFDTALPTSEVASSRPVSSLLHEYESAGFPGRPHIKAHLVHFAPTGALREN